jgi:hypothetical protein
MRIEMAVPVIVCLFALASLAGDAKATTTVTMDEKSFAVIVPVKDKDRYINVTVVTNSNNEEVSEGCPDSAFVDEPSTDEVKAVIDEKKTEPDAKPSN